MKLPKIVGTNLVDVRRFVQRLLKQFSILTPYTTPGDAVELAKSVTPTMVRCASCEELVPHWFVSGDAFGVDEYAPLAEVYKRAGFIPLRCGVCQGVSRFYPEEGDTEDQICALNLVYGFLLQHERAREAYDCVLRRLDAPAGTDTVSWITTGWPLPGRCDDLDLCLAVCSDPTFFPGWEPYHVLWVTDESKLPPRLVAYVALLEAQARRFYFRTKTALFAWVQAERDALEVLGQHLDPSSVSELLQHMQPLPELVGDMFQPYGWRRK